MDTMITNVNEEAVENAVEAVVEETCKKNSLAGLKNVGIVGLGLSVIGGIGYLIYKKRVKKNASSEEQTVTVEHVELDCDEVDDDNN